MEEALRRAAEIMIEDFNNAGGPLLDYGEPTERKIGPYGARNVSEEFIYVYFCYDKELMMDLFVCVQGYDAKKSAVLTSVFPCPFFDHAIAMCNGNSNTKEGRQNPEGISTLHSPNSAELLRIELYSGGSVVTATTWLQGPD